jgi:hypothetical protein
LHAINNDGMITGYSADGFGFLVNSGVVWPKAPGHVLVLATAGASRPNCQYRGLVQ